VELDTELPAVAVLLGPQAESDLDPHGLDDPTPFD
jgi:hypothetical protein